MWFKNLSVFRLTEALPFTPNELEEKLQTAHFRPCAPHQESTFGWTVPVGNATASLVHTCGGFMMLCGKKEERVLPTAVINEMTQERILEAEDRQGHKLSKKERSRIKDELIFELLPKAFTFSRKTYAYIDTLNGFIIVDSASSKSAEDVLSYLRKTLGSLPAQPLMTAEKPSAVLTDWLTRLETPADIKIEDECELRSPEEAGGIVRCKRHDLTLPEIKNHLDSGKQVIKLAISWADRLAFVVDENLAIKRLRFLDLVNDQIAEIDAEDEVARFDADFSIMSHEIANFLPELLTMFGGEMLA